MRTPTALAKRSLAILLAISLQLLFLHGSALAQGSVEGKLVTTGNQSILVNGNQLSSGGTVLSGATIETPPGVGATINLGPLGSVDLAPGTQAVLEFSDDGKIKVKVLKGCAVVNTKKGTEGEVETEQGSQGKTNKEQAGALSVCAPGSTPPGPGPGGGPSGGWVAFGAAGFLGFVIASYIIANRDDNPSPS